MGFTPRDVDECTLWEFQACAEGYRDAHRVGDEPAPAMGDDELAALGVDGF